MAGFLSDALAPLNLFKGIESSIMGVISKIQSMIRQAVQKSTMMSVFQIFAVVFAIGKCIFAFFDLFVGLLMWAFYFIIWFPSKFIPWFAMFTWCTINKILMLPRCFLWYGLDTAGWALYLPFRFTFWLLDQIFDIGLVKMEHDVWCFLDDIDHFIHDSGDGLGTGFHIIHFPDSVMKTCYSCDVGDYPPGPTFPIDKLMKFFKCIVAPF